MRKLFIDFETRSASDLKLVGAHRYNLDPTTEVLLCSYAFDDEPVHVSTEVPREVWDAIEDDTVLKIAHNDDFDKSVCKYVLGIEVNHEAWFDTAYQAAYYGLPRSLRDLANVLGTKKKGGGDGIEVFSKPIKAKLKRATTAANKEYNRLISLMPAKFNTREDFPEIWADFEQYSADDTDVMRECFNKMPMLPELELDAMRLTGYMNFNGVPFDTQLAGRIMERAHAYETNASAEALKRFGIVNLRSTPQVHAALAKEGIYLESLDAKKRGDVSHAILELRDQATGAAFKKLPKAIERVCPDGRIRGEFVGFGAHTGRWSSRGVQLQNWARITSEVSERLDTIRDYGHLRQHLRLCLGNHPRLLFTCADLSQIEARIVAYLAGCKWLMEVFASGGDPYSSTAQKMFGGAYDPATGKHPKRQYGKAAVLGFGYGGSGKAIERIDKRFYDEIGEAAAQDLCYVYRSAHPEIKQLWYKLMDAWKEAVRKTVSVIRCNNVVLKFMFDGKTMRIMLPSGRALYYRGVRMTPSEYGYDFAYANYGDGHVTYEKIWHGTLIENIVQAIARDILVGVMRRAKERAPEAEIIGSVHDEAWFLHPRGTPMLDIVLEEMARSTEWAKGLVTGGDGFTSDRYRK